MFLFELILLFHYRTLDQFSPLIRNKSRFHLILLQNGHLELCSRLACRCYFFEFFNYFRYLTNPKISCDLQNLSIFFLFISLGGGGGYHHQLKITYNLVFSIPTIYTVSKKWKGQLHLIFFFILYKNRSITKQPPNHHCYLTVAFQS